MKRSKMLMIAAAVLPLFLFLFPMWNITLEAPQYPIPLGIDISVHKMDGAHEGDIQNIDLMNHYVGMKKLPTDMVEFDIFPIVIGAMSLIGIGFGFLGKKKLFLVWFIVMVILGISGMYDFYLWLYDYGHNLDPHAAIKMPGQAYAASIRNKADSKFYCPFISDARFILSIHWNVLSPGRLLFRTERRKENFKLRFLGYIILSVSMSLVFISCSIEPSPIDYGKDACIYCKMNIVDKQHAAEIVTKKGKPFKYDAIECMMQDIMERDENDIAMFLMTDYSNPGVLVDATKSTYLISENLPSPMGANLTGFGSKDDAQKIKKEKDGEIYSWTELKELFSERSSR